MSIERVITHNSTFKQGTNWGISVICMDNNGNLIPLTGYKARCQFRTKSGGLVLEASSEVGNNRIVLDEPNGALTINLSFSDTNLFPVGMVDYDVFIQNAAGTRRDCPVGGEIEVTKKTTEWPTT